MSAALPLLSPLVTRILELKGFPAELKTRDIQTIFAQWEDERGGFKIKWIDDITVLVIFSDPICAKRAYLQVLMSPPPMLMTASGIMAKIRPYDGEDAGSIISSVQNRPRSRSNAGGQATPAYGAENEAGQAPTIGATPSRAAGGNSGSPRSVARSLGQGHRRNPSGSNPSSLPPKPLAAALWDASNGGPSPAHHLANALAAEGLPEKAEEILASINANTIRSPSSTANSTTAILEPSPEIRKAEKTSQALGA